MPSPDLTDEAAAGPFPGDLAEAGAYLTASEGFDHGLVVLAMGLPYWLVPSGARFRLLVEPQALDEAGGTALARDIVEAMTTNESFFFRDTKPFDQFRKAPGQVDLAT